MHIQRHIFTSMAPLPSARQINGLLCSGSSFIPRYLCITLLIFISNSCVLTKAQDDIFLPSDKIGSSPNSAPACPAVNPNLYYRPVIGILSHPGDGASGRLSNATHASYIAASYVKFVESGGARVIPIFYNEPPEIIQKKLSLVNGVLFPGGWAKFGLYYATFESIFKKALEKNDAGDHFPVYAINLGFEILSMVVSDDNDILESLSAKSRATTLKFTETENIEGSIFQRFPPDLRQKLSTDCLVYRNHRYGLSPERLQNNDKLSSFFKVLTTSLDDNNKVYVSTVQARKYPVTGFQWHPEKNAFEWGSPNIPHSEDAIRVTQIAARFLVSEARKSLNRPPAKEVLEHLIYNYTPTYGGKFGKGYDEVYIFP